MSEDTPRFRIHYIIKVIWIALLKKASRYPTQHMCTGRCLFTWLIKTLIPNENKWKSRTLWEEGKFKTWIEEDKWKHIYFEEVGVRGKLEKVEGRCQDHLFHGFGLWADPELWPRRSSSGVQTNGNHSVSRSHPTGNKYWPVLNIDPTNTRPTTTIYRFQVAHGPS